MNPKKTARTAGILYLVITVAAIFAHFVVPDALIVPGDAAATAQNITESEAMFRFGAIGSELVILLSEVFLSVILYLLLKPVNKTLSLLAALFRLIMTTIHGLNLLNYFFVILLLNGNFITVFGPEQVQALITLFLDAHSYGFIIGIAFLVPHVLILGYLIFKSGYFPKVLGILFLLAGLGYLIDTAGQLLFTGYYESTPGVIAATIAIAEIAFPVWLLIKGVRIEEWKKRVLESA